MRTLVKIVLFSSFLSSAQALVLEPSGLQQPGMTRTHTQMELSLEGKLPLGLDLEPEDERRQILREAEAYTQLRNSRNQKFEAAYGEYCHTQAGPNDGFCAIEKLRLEVGKTEKIEINSRQPKAQVLKDLESTNIENLVSLSLPDLLRGFNAFESTETLQKIAETVASQSTCQIQSKNKANLAFAIASRSEELFPDPLWLKLAEKLYAQAGECATNEVMGRARFRAGLIAVWQGRCTDAEIQLQEVEGAKGGREFWSRARYWRHYCAVSANNTELAEQMKERLFREHRMSFHNLLINGNESALQVLLEANQPSRIQFRSWIRPDLNPSFRAIEGLVLIHQYRLAAAATENLLPEMTSLEPEVRVYLAAVMNRAGQALPKFKILASLFQDAPRTISASSLKLYFPVWYLEEIKKRSGRIDPLLILALIRQESAFNAQARSGAGARGLMQVMPATARSIASVSIGNLYDPQTNIHVGTKYFANRLDQYGGSVEFTLAAYNAGFGRVDRWLKRYPVENRVLFMDLIPFKETREYVASILRNYYWYSKLYNGSAVTLRDR